MLDGWNTQFPISCVAHGHKANVNRPLVRTYVRTLEHMHIAHGTITAGYALRLCVTTDRRQWQCQAEVYVLF